MFGYLIQETDLVQVFSANVSQTQVNLFLQVIDLLLESNILSLIFDGLLLRGFKLCLALYGVPVKKPAPLNALQVEALSELLQLTVYLLMVDVPSEDATL